MPPNALESALVLDLPAGAYTAVVRGTNRATGNALVEVYHLDWCFLSHSKVAATTQARTTGPQTKYTIWCKSLIHIPRSEFRGICA
jgi:hypothetical protein